MPLNTAEKQIIKSTVLPWRSKCAINASHPLPHNALNQADLHLLGLSHEEISFRYRLAFFNLLIKLEFSIHKIECLLDTRARYCLTGFLV